ncbi:MAG: nucleotidyltransferase domain-containing protein [Flavobacteriales bacterium]|nr:nucleotidyltransferase domain-containing protein [Flavobacteriales bacterium]MCC6937995.1 nucleotidyltransferase domain-containing protein [Flavobacteriales bacterium]
MLDLEPRHLAIVRAILHRNLPGAQSFAFGSRAIGHAKRFSDLDIAVRADAPLDLRQLGDLREEFSESDMPMLVDVIDLRSISTEFAESISASLVPLG